MTSIFDQGLEPRNANYAVQSPIDFIERTASVYPDYPAIIHGAIRRNWAEDLRSLPPAGVCPEGPTESAVAIPLR